MSFKDVFLDENLQVFVCEVDTELVKGVGGQLVMFCGLGRSMRPVKVAKSLRY